MVHMDAVAEFVDDHVIDDFRRRQHKQAVEVQIAFGTAAAPARFLVADRDIAECYAHFFRDFTDPEGNVAEGILCQFFNIFISVILILNDCIFERYSSVSMFRVPSAGRDQFG